jgi:hypothetical protein
MAMGRTTKRWLACTLFVLSTVWLAFVGYVGWAMRQPPEVFGSVMAKMPMPAYFLFPFETMWTNARRGQLNVGSTAPDFAVEALDTKTPIQLASLWSSRPVVLVFGSYT